MLVPSQKMQSDIQATIDELSSSKTHEPKPGLFSTILQSNLSPQDRTAERIAREAMSLLIAGSETTAFTMSTITYQVLANPATLAKLRAALRQAIPDPNALPLPLGQLEAIPYLHACVQEGLRLAYGTSNRLTRVARTPIQYRDWDIPAGVPVGMTTVFMHDDESIFPNHTAFRPERWLEPRDDGVRLEKYLTSFGRGTRQCLGIKYVLFLFSFQLKVFWVVVPFLFLPLRDQFVLVFVFVCVWLTRGTRINF